jgi:hypothetical protein
MVYEQRRYVKGVHGMEDKLLMAMVNSNANKKRNSWNQSHCQPWRKWQWWQQRPREQLFNMWREEVKTQMRKAAAILYAGARKTDVVSIVR